MNQDGIWDMGELLAQDGTLVEYVVVHIGAPRDAGPVSASEAEWVSRGETVHVLATFEVD